MRRLFLPLAFMMVVTPVGAQPTTGSGEKFEESEKGLTQFLTELLDRAAAGDTEALRNSMVSLSLPDPGTWFRHTFGEILGAEIAASYVAVQPQMTDQLLQSFQLFAQEQRRIVFVQKIRQNCQPEVLRQQYPALIARENKTPFYSVLFKKDKDEETARALWFFVFEEGHFRYAGAVRLDNDKLLANRSGVRIGGPDQKVKLTHTVPPRYPSDAKSKHIQGTVRLVVLLGTNGIPLTLQVISGNCSLAEEAVRTVRQWRYEPTILGGRPTEVLTTVDVIFQLQN